MGRRDHHWKSGIERPPGDAGAPYQCLLQRPDTLQAPGLRRRSPSPMGPPVRFAPRTPRAALRRFRREKPAAPEPNGAASEGTARSETQPGGPDRELDGSVPHETIASAPGDAEVTPWPRPAARSPAPAPAPRCSQTGCARTSSTFAAGRPGRTSTASASTTPTCPSTPSPWTSTRTGHTSRSTPRPRRSTPCRRGAG